MKIIYLTQQKKFEQLLVALGLTQEQQKKVIKNYTELFWFKLLGAIFSVLPSSSVQSIGRMLSEHDQDYLEILGRYVQQIDPTDFAKLLKHTGQEVREKIFQSINQHSTNSDFVKLIEADIDSIYLEI